MHFIAIQAGITTDTVFGCPTFSVSSGGMRFVHTVSTRQKKKDRGAVHGRWRQVLRQSENSGSAVVTPKSKGAPEWSQRQ